MCASTNALCVTIMKSALIVIICQVIRVKSTDTHPAVRTRSTLSYTCWRKVRHYITIGTNGLGGGTNLCKAESHSVRVMVLRNEDAGHKILEFIGKAICHHDDQAECENQGLQCMIG